MRHSRTNSISRTLAFALILCSVCWLSNAQEPDTLQPIVSFKGHQNAVYSVAFSPDGTLVATGGFDQAVKLWEAKTGKEIRSFTGAAGHQNLVLSVAFSPTGDSLASGSSDNTARVWDIPIRSPLKDLIHPSGVTSVAVSPDGKLVAGAGKDGSIQTWAAADGKMANSAMGHPGGATGVAFTPNGQFLVSAGADESIRFWNPATGQAIVQVGAHSGKVTGLTGFASNNTVASVGEDGFLKWWQVPPVPARSLPAHGDLVTALLVSTDGANVYSAGNDKAVKWSTTANGQLVRDFAGATAAQSSLAVFSGGLTLVGGGTDGKLTFWKTDDGKLIAQTQAHAGAITGLDRHPALPQFATVGADGLLKTWAVPLLPSRMIATPDRVLAATMSGGESKRLFTAGADKMVRSWTYVTGAAERQFAGHTAPVTALAVSVDGTTLISAGEDETIRFWNVATGTQTAQIGGHAGAVHSLAVAVSGNLLVSAGDDGTVKMWQLPSVAAKPFVHPDAVQFVSVSPDGNRMATIANDKQARIWNVQSGQMERTHGAGSGAISAVAFAADGATLAVAGADKSLSTWNAGKEAKKFPALDAPAQSLAFAPNSPTLAAGLADNSIHLLNSNEGKEIKNLAGHTGPITSVCFTPKGDLLVSASADKSVRLWNAADGEAKGQFAHTAPIQALAISKDGSRVAAGGDKSVSLWTLADGKPAGIITTDAEIKGLSLSSDGQKIAIACTDGKVRIYGNDGKLQETFLHDGPATSVAFLADGKRLVSTSADKTARLWTSSLIAQGFHAGPARQVTVAASGDRVFSVGDDKHLRVWDARTAKELKSIAVHDSAIVGFGLSADATKAVTAGADKTAKVWNLVDGKVITSIPLAGPAQATAMTANGTRVAIAYADQGNKVRTFDTATGKELQTIAEPAGSVRSLSFLSDNRTLLTAGDDKQVSISDAAAQSAFNVHEGGAVGVYFHPIGTQVLTAGKDKAVRLWDLPSGKEAKAFGPMSEAVSALAVSRDFTLVAAAAGKVLKIWQVADGKEIATINHAAEILSIAFSPDKSRLVTGGADNLARVWDVPAGRLLQSFRHAGPVRAVAYHPALPQVFTAGADKSVQAHTLVLQRLVAASSQPLRAVTAVSTGTHFVTAGDDKNVKAWNPATGADERTFTGAEGPVYAVATSKNANLLAASGADKTIRIYTFADAKLIATIPAPAVVRGIAFHPSLPILAAVCDDNSVNAWNIAFTAGMPLPPEFGRLIQSFAHADAALGIAFAEQGPLYTASEDKTIKQWKIAADAPIRNFQHPNFVDAVAFDPTGKLLATGCHDGTLRIFDLEKNASLKSIVAHQQTQPEPRNFQIYSVAWSPDGKQVLTASFDKSMKLWDVATGTLVREFKPFADKDFPKGHRDQIFCAVFTKDGKFIATGSSDRMIKLWNTADGTVVREFANSNIKQLPPPESPEAHPGWVYGLRFSADEKTLYSVGAAPKNRGYLAAWNVADGKMISGSELLNGPIYSVALSKDGTHLLLGCGPRERSAPASEAIIVPTPK